MIGDTFLHLENHRNEKRSQFALKIDKTALKYSLQGKNFKDAMSVKKTSLNKKYSPSKLLQAFSRNIKIKRLPINRSASLNHPPLLIFFAFFTLNKAFYISYSHFQQPPARL